jgi:hypothetical protein
MPRSKGTTQKTWPKRVTAYVHASDESMWEIGESIGLTEAANHMFKFALTELTIELEVYKNGTSKIVSVDGQPYQESEADVF